MPGIALWELLSYIVTVVALPLAIFTFWHEQRKERENEDEETYQLLSDAYADFALDNIKDWSNKGIDLATGQNFADALAAGPSAGELARSILLTAPAALSKPRSDWLLAHSGTLLDGRVYGGTAAVSNAVVDAAEAAGQGSTGGAQQGQLTFIDKDNNGVFSTGDIAQTTADGTGGTTLGLATLEMRRAYALPIKANCSSSFASQRIVAPTSSMSAKRSCVGCSVCRGYTLASAARRTPRMSFQCLAHASTQAPVLPADTIASARPSATARTPTSREASRRDLTASRGSSAIPIASLQWRIEMCSGL